MLQRRHIFGLLIGSALLAWLPVSGMAGRASAEVVDRVVATIDGEPLTLYELRRFAAVIKGTAGVSLDETARDFWSKMLEALVTERIVRKEAAKRGLTASDKEVDRYLEQIQRRNGVTEEGLKSAVVAQGLAWDNYREKVQFDIERSKLLEVEIGEKVTVSPEEIKRYYESNREAYHLPEQMQVWDIYIRSGRGRSERKEARRRAEECHERARKGEDFAKLASKYSTGPGAAEGGDIGSIARGQMREELEGAVFKLAEDEISEVVETEDGFHIFKAGKREGRKYRPLEEVSDEIRTKLYDELLEKRYRRWLAKDLRSRHHVEMISPVGEVEEK